MDESLQTQIETYLTHLEGLIRRGRELQDRLATDSGNGLPNSGSAIAETRAWQEDCGVTINQLSGGSKAHWLARSFSGAFLMRSAAGHAVESASPAEIVQRLLDVLEQAVATLSGMDGGNAQVAASSEAPPPHKFDFVHNPELRSVLEEAYMDSRRALEQADYDAALRISCGILEAIVTDALEHKGLAALTTSVISGQLPGTIAEEKTAEEKIAEEKIAAGKTGEERIADWSFATRLAVAERAGLIRGGCARLPAVARAYRDHDRANGVKPNITERDARVAGQVLHVVMRDLDPGR